jgi:hypothetical protein
MRTMRATITNVGGITKTYKRVERTLRVFDDGDDGDDGDDVLCVHRDTSTARRSHGDAILTRLHAMLTY